jgi:hypothetical protein
MCVRADVVESEHALTGVTDYDLATFEDARLHASLGDLGQCHYRHERRIGHV